VFDTGGHMAAEKALLPEDAFNTEDYLTSLDGAKTLIKNTELHNPKASMMRCSRHLLADLACGGAHDRESIEIYQKLLQMPKGHDIVANRIYDQLPSQSSLRKIPKEQLAPVFLKKVKVHVDSFVMLETSSHCICDA
jgi:hypothetical protein